MKALKFYTYLFFCIVPIFVAGLFEGDQCETEKVTGKCLKIGDCNNATDLIKRNQTPQDCGFENNTSLVCCPISSETSENVTTNKTTEEQKATEKAEHVSTDKTTEKKKPKPKRGPRPKPKSIYVVSLLDGELCETDGLVGTCLDLQNCSYAADLRRRNIEPQYCTGKHEYEVCCPTSDASMSGDTVGKKSFSKCAEYAGGYRRFDSFGYGGALAQAIEFPHMAVLGYGNETTWLCGGTLISEQFVLTAAHCIESPDYGQVNKVRLGELDLDSTDDDASPEDFEIAEIFKHPDYKPPSRYNDIALLKLDRNVTISIYITPACLYPFSEAPAHGLITTGWGQTNFYGPASSHLIKVYLDYIPHKECAKRYEHISTRELKHGIDAKTQTCAGAEDGRDACAGDSGGPLQVKNQLSIGYKSTAYYSSVVAITSFGQGCGFNNSVGVYTKVAPYISWIEETVWPEGSV